MLSVIIPVLNEAETIQNLIEYLINKKSGAHTIEFIIIDGGSSDNTILKCNGAKKRFPSECIRLIHSPRGRAKQMNYGAFTAEGDILYFLHADSFPPQDYDRLIVQKVLEGSPAGCFKMRFTSNHWWLKLVSWFTQFNWKIARGGDQSLFIHREFFKSLGGFDESYLIYEDNALINKIYKQRSFTVIQKWLSTSSRRYEEMGIFKLQYHYTRIHLKNYFGAHPDKLAAYYEKNIK